MALQVSLSHTRLVLVVVPEGGVVRGESSIALLVISFRPTSVLRFGWLSIWTSRAKTDWPK